MGVQFVQLGNETLIDLRNDTVTPDTLANGVTAHDMNGNKITGTLVKHNAKIYHVTVPTAVAATDVVVVSGDPDVAAHYTDEHAMVTVRKITNNNSVGINFLIQTNHAAPLSYGLYGNYNGTQNNGTTIAPTLGGISNQNQSSSPATPYVRCTASGNIIVRPLRTNNNFGGAEYIITFSW